MHRGHLGRGRPPTGSWRSRWNRRLFQVWPIPVFQNSQDLRPLGGKAEGTMRRGRWAGSPAPHWVAPCGWGLFPGDILSPCLSQKARGFLAPTTGGPHCLGSPVTLSGHKGGGGTGWQSPPLAERRPCPRREPSPVSSRALSARVAALRGQVGSQSHPAAKLKHSAGLAITAAGRLLAVRFLA